MSCDLVTGWCEIEYVSRKRDLPAARFRVAAAKLAPYATIGEGVHYGERGESPVDDLRRFLLELHPRD